jgi:hypothetical protein
MRLPILRPLSPLRWIGAIEAVLEKAGQGSDDATIAANDLNASNDE